MRLQEQYEGEKRLKIRVEMQLAEKEAKEFKENQKRLEKDLEF
jgi:hypothetical protein